MSRNIWNSLLLNRSVIIVFSVIFHIFLKFKNQTSYMTFPSSIFINSESACTTAVIVIIMSMLCLQFLLLYISCSISKPQVTQKFSFIKHWQHLTSNQYKLYCCKHSDAYLWYFFSDNKVCIFTLNPSKLYYKVFRRYCNKLNSTNEEFGYLLAFSFSH